MECRHAGRCPGCPAIGLGTEAQLTAKAARLAGALGHFPHLPRASAIVGNPWREGYRHRLKLPVGREGGRVQLGLYADGRVVDTPDCPVLHPALRSALPPLATWLVSRPEVHAVDLRVSAATGDLQLVLAGHGGEVGGGGRALRDLRNALPKLASVAVSRADPEGKRVMGSAPRWVAGAATLRETVGPTSYALTPGAFFQVDPRQAETLQRIVREGVGDAQRVLDLYAGVGAYGLMLAQGRSRVVLVEEVPQAAEAARSMAPRNVTVLCGRVEDVELTGPFDAVILNPARRGSDPEVLARVAQLAPRLIYVSCGPETLARDLDALAFHGMRVRSITPIDLFPQTFEVETVVVLERGAPLTHVSVPGGQATGPWGGQPSGAVGKPRVATALVIGDPGAKGSLPGGRFTRVGRFATHALLRVEVTGSLVRALSALAAKGHPLAGRDGRTRRFFAERAGLVRPFVHIDEADGAVAPLHGDLVMALDVLRRAPVAPRPVRSGRAKRR